MAEASVVAAPGAHVADKSNQAILAAAIGNLLEWYDFGVYAYLAGLIATKFFPNSDPTASLLAAFAAYGVGFLARPLGGIVIGRLGDTKGRKTALVLTIFLMAFGTVGLGLLPSYEAIGVWAPILLVCLRIVQGLAPAASGAPRPPSWWNGRRKTVAAYSAVSSRSRPPAARCSARPLLPS